MGKLTELKAANKAAAAALQLSHDKGVSLRETLAILPRPEDKLAFLAGYGTTVSVALVLFSTLTSMIATIAAFAGIPGGVLFLILWRALRLAFNPRNRRLEHVVKEMAWAKNLELSRGDLEQIRDRGRALLGVERKVLSRGSPENAEKRQPG